MHKMAKIIHSLHLVRTDEVKQIEHVKRVCIKKFRDQRGVSFSHGLHAGAAEANVHRSKAVN